MGNGGCGHFITCCLCSSFLLRGRDSSHSTPAPMWGSFHRRQFCMNFFNMNPSYRLQLFMNCYSVGPFPQDAILEELVDPAWVPRVSEVLPTNLFWRGVLSPWVHRSWQEPAPAQASHGVTASFGHPPALAWGASWSAGGYLLHHGPPWAAGGQPASPWSALRAAGENLCSGTWRTSLSSFPTDLGVCRVFSLTYCHSSGGNCCSTAGFSPS